MKCEQFSQISDLVDYLSNNLLIAHYCGFDITRKLPSYDSFTRFIRNFDNDVLKNVMKDQVKECNKLNLVDNCCIALDSTPIKANVSNNNPKSFKKNKFSKSNKPKADKTCQLGVHSASNNGDEKNYEFYWGYKNHVLVDCISGLPIYEITTGANVADSTVTIDMLKETHSFLNPKPSEDDDDHKRNNPVFRISIFLWNKLLKILCPRPKTLCPLRRKSFYFWLKNK